MKIAINALGVDGGGGQTYIENLLPELDRLENSHRYDVLLREGHSVFLPSLSPRFRIVLMRIPRPFLVGRFLLEQFYLPFWLKRNKIDLLYSPADATTLLSPCPVVLAMRNPNLYAEGDLRWPLRSRLKFAVFSRLAALSARKAKQVIFVSLSSRKLVEKKIDIPSEKINVIHHGVSDFFLKSPEPLDFIEEMLNDKTPYILSVSSIYRYKNYVRLIEAFHQIADRLPGKYHLLIVGSSFDNPYYKIMRERIKDLGIEETVHCMGGFLLRKLPPIYQRASLFAFPSFLETFGHTLVEAMASGIPIAAGDIESTREITGGAALYFDPFSVDDMARSLHEALTDAGLRERLIAKGKQQVDLFSWEKCGRETAEAFRKAVSR